MSKVVMTGATGNAGSALAAGLLNRGADVVCLSRNDDSGNRTREAIAGALEQFGWDKALAAKVPVLPLDLRQIDADGRRALEGAESVWLCAAAMSYAPARLAESFAFNVAATSGYYRYFTKNQPIRRLFYMSTTYVAGVSVKPAPEALHTTSLLHNPYLVTKWGAEMALSHLTSQPGGPPVTIFRTPIIVGNSETGIYRGGPLAVHTFWDSLRIAAKLGAKEVRLDIDGAVRHNYLPINDLVANAVALTLDAEGGERLVVGHAAGTELTNEEALAWSDPVLGVRVVFGAPETAEDRAADANIAPNKPYNRIGLGLSYRLEDRVFGAALGAKHTRHTLGTREIERLARWYCENAPLPERAA